ncbi:hypothetical protein LTR66_007540 [Elasticomyces elasticus]|nr:hypothetical protein LTR66_007540 [Elasticomyces elasticus]
MHVSRPSPPSSEQDLEMAALRALYPSIPSPLAPLERMHHIKSIRRPPLPKARLTPGPPLTYADLGYNDIRLLTSLLSYAPRPSLPNVSKAVQDFKEVSKAQISYLPSHLKSKISIISVFCKLHKRLNVAAVTSVYKAFKYEVDTELYDTWLPLRHAGLLTLEQNALLTVLENVSALWLRPAVFQVQTGHEPEERWKYQDNECAACLLARLGGHEEACVALGAVVLGSMKTDMESKRVVWIESWLRAVGKDGDSFIAKTRRLGSELREVRQGAKRADKVVQSRTDSVCGPQNIMQPGSVTGEPEHGLPVTIPRCQFCLPEVRETSSSITCPANVAAPDEPDRPTTATSHYSRPVTTFGQFIDGSFRLPDSPMPPLPLIPPLFHRSGDQQSRSHVTPPSVPEKHPARSAVTVEYSEFDQNPFSTPQHAAKMSSLRGIPDVAYSPKSCRPCGTSPRPFICLSNTTSRKQDLRRDQSTIRSSHHSEASDEDYLDDMTELCENAKIENSIIDSYRYTFILQQQQSQPATPRPGHLTAGALLATSESGLAQRRLRRLAGVVTDHR